MQVWDANNGRTFTNIEPLEGSINDVCLWKDSGLIMLACTSPRIPVKPIPPGPLLPLPRPLTLSKGGTREANCKPPAQGRFFSLPVDFDDIKH